MDKVIKKYKSIRVQTKLKPMNGKMVRSKYRITKEYNITTIIQLLYIQFKNNNQILCIDFTP